MKLTSKSEEYAKPDPPERFPGLYTDGQFIYLVTEHTNGKNSPVIGSIDSARKNDIFTTYTSANVLKPGCNAGDYWPFYGKVTIECQG